MPLRGPGRYPAPVPAPLHWAHSSSAPTTSFAQVNIYQAPTYCLAKPKCYDRHMRFYPRNASFFIYYLCDFGQIIPLSLSFLTGHRHDNRWVVVNEAMHDKALAHCPATLQKKGFPFILNSQTFPNVSRKPNLETPPFLLFVCMLPNQRQAMAGRLFPLRVPAALRGLLSAGLMVGGGGS